MGCCGASQSALVNAGAETFIALSDTPDAYTDAAGKICVVNETADGLIFLDILPPTNGGTGLATYTAGDLIYADDADSLAALPIGTEDQVLTVDASGLPVWADAAATGITALANVGSGAQVYKDESSGTANLRTLVDGDYITLNQTTDEITVTCTSPATLEDLEDGPGSYSGDALEILRVNAAADGFEFISAVPVAQGGTGLSSYTTGAILYADGVSSFSTVGIGTEGQVLAVSAGGIPEWVTPSGGGGMTESGGGTNSIQGVTTDTPARNNLGTGSVDLQQYRSSAAQAATGYAAVISGGENNTSSASVTTVSGGINNAATLNYAVIPGGANASANHSGEFTMGTSAVSAKGQWGTLPFTLDTTNATKTIMTLMEQAAARPSLAANETWHCTLRVTARQKSTGGDHAIFTREFMAYRNGSGNVTLVNGGTGITPVQTGGSPSGWVIDVTADTSNQAIQIEVTGEASHNIRWVASLHFTKAIYA